ncbi:dihydrofolate reductase family protein [Microbacterium sp. AZCO]|uniref:dihydrofolate reductase family protein n=1 Tax=Microbacterium sp. AZCO TaxID=3142976 RepID=UPI0031F3B015
MLIYSMGVSADGFISDREGGFDWGAPDEELFAFHLERVAGLGAHVSGRRLYEAMLPWETDPAMRATPLYARFADVWSELPKVVFSRTLDRVEGNARLAEASLPDELSTVLAGTGRNVEVGGATLAAQAIEAGFVDEFRIFRYPIVVGGGTPFFPPLARQIPLELLESRTFQSRVVYERYRRAPHD